MFDQLQHFTSLHLSL